MLLDELMRLHEIFANLLQILPEHEPLLNITNWQVVPTAMNSESSLHFAQHTIHYSKDS